MLNPSFFNTILIIPLINILLFFNFIFDSIHLPWAFGWSIVALTIFVRVILHPMTAKQMLLAKKMEELKPHMDILSQKHGKDKKRLQEEQLKLYKEMGINPASGCLYALVQIPLFIGLYQVLQLFLTNGSVSKISATVNKIVYYDFLKISSIDPMFLGFNLGVAPQQFGKYGVHYLAIPLITAFLQYLQVKYTMPAPKKVEKKANDKKTDEKQQPDMQTMMQGQMKFMFPLMIGYFSFILPVGLALYWNVFSIFSILQYRKK